VTDQPNFLRWWIVYTQPLPLWEVDDLEEVREAIAQKPPNRSIEHPSIVGFLAGYFQAVGEIGYLGVQTEEREIYVPFVELAGEREVMEKFIRLIGEVHQVEEGGSFMKLLITGLRAIIFLRIISPFLLGRLRNVAEEVVKNGYKISDANRAKELLGKLRIRKIEEMQDGSIGLKKFSLV